MPHYRHSFTTSATTTTKPRHTRLSISLQPSPPPSTTSTASFFASSSVSTENSILQSEIQNSKTQIAESRYHSSAEYQQFCANTMSTNNKHNAQHSNSDNHPENGTIFDTDSVPISMEQVSPYILDHSQNLSSGPEPELSSVSSMPYRFISATSPLSLPLPLESPTTSSSTVLPLKVLVPPYEHYDTFSHYDPNAPPFTSRPSAASLRYHNFYDTTSGQRQHCLSRKISAGGRESEILINRTARRVEFADALWRRRRKSRRYSDDDYELENDQNSHRKLRRRSRISSQDVEDLDEPGDHNQIHIREVRNGDEDLEEDEEEDEEEDDEEDEDGIEEDRQNRQDGEDGDLTRRESDLMHFIRSVRSRSPSFNAFGACKRSQMHRVSLLGKPLPIRFHKHQNPFYNQIQINMHNFLERPRGWRPMIYHVLM